MGVPLPGLYAGVLVSALAAAAVECTTPQLLEPLGHALWAAASTCHEEGGGGGGGDGADWLAGILSATVNNPMQPGGGEKNPFTELQVEGVRFGAVTAVDGVAFARAVARRPPHPALRLAELVAVFGRACRGQGPASAISDFLS